MGNCVYSKNETVLNDILQRNNQPSEFNPRNEENNLDKNSILEKNMTFHSSSDAYTETQKNENIVKFVRNEGNEYEIESFQIHSPKNIIINCIFLGDFQSGKSSLINQIIENKFISCYIQTNEIKKYSKTIPDINKQQIFNFIEIPPGLIDTEESSDLIQITDYVVFLFDFSSYESFQLIKNYREKFKNCKNLYEIIIGNKCDLPIKQVSILEAKMYCFENKIEFFECSAKKGKGLDSFLNHIGEMKKEGLEEM